MPRMKTAAAAHGLSAEGAPWLDRRAIEIAAKHLGAGNEEPNGERRAGDNCGLVIYRNGCWHDFLNEKTGHGALSLFALLHHDDAEAGLEAARDRLAQHGGDKQLGRANGDDEDREDVEAIAADYAWSTAYVDTLQRCAKAIGDTPAGDYLKSRGVWSLPTKVDGSCGGPNRRGDEDVLIAGVALRRAKREHPLLNP
jgi:hypothetical protein